LQGFGVVIAFQANRKKGRDLFDMYWALKNLDIDIEKLIHCYKVHMENAVDKPPTQKQFLANMTAKIMSSHVVFLLVKLLISTGIVAS